MLLVKRVFGVTVNKNRIFQFVVVIKSRWCLLEHSGFAFSISQDVDVPMLIPSEDVRLGH